MKIAEKILEVVDSECCRCGTPILAQIVPDICELKLTNHETGKYGVFRAIEWCPKCQEFHGMKEIPNPETRRPIPTADASAIPQDGQIAEGE